MEKQRIGIIARARNSEGSSGCGGVGGCGKSLCVTHNDTTRLGDYYDVAHGFVVCSNARSLKRSCTERTAHTTKRQSTAGIGHIEAGLSMCNCRRFYDWLVCVFA